MTVDDVLSVWLTAFAAGLLVALVVRIVGGR